MVNKLYTYPENFRAYKALVAAQYSGTPLEVVKDFKYGETNKTEQFLSKFPSGKVPALETSNGEHLNDATAIALYLSNEQLRGVDQLTQVKVQEWLSFAENELLPPVVSAVFPILKILQLKGDEIKKANEELTKVVTILNNALNGREYLVNNQVTLADIAVATYLIPLLQHVWDNEKLAKFSNIEKWFNNLVSQKQFSVLGQLNLKQAKKKAAQPAAGSGKAGDQGDDEPVAPKPKDPFLQFPAGTFDMDEFKREYSNKSEDESIKYFWEKFDKDHYSIWFCEYLFPEELTKVFMSCNLIGGMMQRLDTMRKHAFGSMCLFGEDNNSTISGIWIWRGQDLAFKLSDNWQVDYESYSWKKLDPNDPETKKVVDEYLRWEGNFNGKKIQSR